MSLSFFFPFVVFFIFILYFPSFFPSFVLPFLSFPLLFHTFLFKTSFLYAFALLSFHLHRFLSFYSFSCVITLTISILLLLLLSSLIIFLSFFSFHCCTESKPVSCVLRASCPSANEAEGCQYFVHMERWASVSNGEFILFILSPCSPRNPG